MSKGFNINVMPDSMRKALDTVVTEHNKKAAEKNSKIPKLSQSGALLMLAAVGYKALYGVEIEGAVPERGGYRLKPEDQKKLEAYDKLMAESNVNPANGDKDES